MGFITDYGESITLTSTIPGRENMIIPRYAYWGYDQSKGKNQVKETSGDLDYLKKKYGVDNEHVVQFPPAKTNLKKGA